MGRILAISVLTGLALLGAGGVVSPAASAAPGPEYKLSWSYQEVADVRDAIDNGDLACDVLSLAAGRYALLGLLCGHNDPELRDAVAEAYFKKCGIDAYLTDGPLSYDATYRYVVCP